MTDRQAAARLEGAQAFLAGRSLTTNPYYHKYAPAERTAWILGWTSQAGRSPQP